MRNKVKIIVSLLTLTVAFLSGLEKVLAQDSSLAQSTEFETLLNYLETENLLLKGDGFPIIKAEVVKKNIKNPKFLIIDIRTEGWFEYGHIKNAINVSPENLLTHFRTKINPSDYDQIVLVCYSGQSAAYFTSLLRIAGYTNVNSMKWGMSSWREDFAEGSWTKNIGNDFASLVETSGNERIEKEGRPTLNTGKTEGKDILNAQLEALFAIPYKEHIVETQALFEDPSKFHIIYYWGEEKQNHIPGASHFNSNVPLTTDLSTLPTDEKVVIYEETGQKAAYALAHLKVLGYDIANLAYGENGFMNDALKKKGGDAFTKKEINMFPVIE